MVTILTGRAGCGKTGEILRRMALRGQDRPQLLLVPEQVSFETERRFCRENGNRAGLYGEVLSFTRLENRVLSLAGGAAQPVLDEGGRVLTLYAALRSVAEHLTVYALPSRRPEFLKSLLATLDELKSGCVTGEKLLEAGADTEGLDGDKLRDLGLIFSAYEARIARGALDPRDRLTRLAEKLRGFAFFRNKDVYLDGFTDFTPQQELVLEEVFRQAHSVTLSLTCGREDGEAEIFAPARKTIVVFRRMAAQARKPVQEEALRPRPESRTAALAYLERQLFASRPLPYNGLWDGSVTVTSLASPREEITWAAGEIKELVEKEKLRWRDIAVSARSMEPYRELLEGIFGAYEIPVFQTDRTNILEKPLFTLVTGALDAVNGGYTYEDMFRYLKTGLAGLNASECDRLENYVLTWNIFGSRWTSPKGWTNHPGGYQRDFTPEDKAALEDLNALRLRVIVPLETFRKSAGGTIREQVLSFYRFLEELHVPEALEARAENLANKGEQELSRQYSQLWEIFCSALEQCAAMVGDLTLDLGDFSRLLRLLLAQYTVGTIPASLDRVTAGELPRLVGRRWKVLFLLGADDTSIPQTAPGPGLLTDRDREILEGYGLTLSPRMEERLGREGTIVYTACAQPGQKLYVSWPRRGEGGEEKRPSFLVDRLSALFPQAMKVCCPAPSPDQLRVLAAGLPEARGALEQENRSASLFRRLDRAAGWKRGKLSQKVVKALCGSKIAMSASRMDQYKSCHFAYFLRFGLGARDRKPAGFHAPEYGTFVHYVLERVLRAAQGRGGVKETPQETLRILTEEAIQSYVRQELGGLENQTPRFRYLFRRLARGMLDIVENVASELRASDFAPVAFELGFGPGKDLPPIEVEEAGVSLQLSGYVDRVDGWTKGGRLYLRVIDYKTGRKTFDLTEIWNGLGLQMLLYLFALEETDGIFGQPVVPAGVLYLPARDAMVAGSRAMGETARRRLLDKELMRRGLLLDDEEVLTAMEHPEGELHFLPLRLNSRTGKRSGDALVSEEKFSRLKDHTRELLLGVCREIAGGNIDADPYWRGPDKNACRYCDYFRACQFEEPDDHRRWLPSVRNSEFWEKLKEKGDGSNGSEENP